MPTHYSARQARDFHSIFGAHLHDYWQGILGFDVTKFDDEIVHSGTMSCRDAVRQTWGVKGVMLIHELLDAQAR